jgi:hypothetical protein
LADDGDGLGRGDVVAGTPFLHRLSQRSAPRRPAFAAKVGSARTRGDYGRWGGRFTSDSSGTVASSIERGRRAKRRGRVLRILSEIPAGVPLNGTPKN